MERSKKVFKSAHNNTHTPKSGEKNRTCFMKIRNGERYGSYLQKREKERGHQAPPWGWTGFQTTKGSVSYLKREREREKSNVPHDRIRRPPITPTSFFGSKCFWGRFVLVVVSHGGGGGGSAAAAAYCPGARRRALFGVLFRAIGS